VKGDERQQITYLKENVGISEGTNLALYNIETIEKIEGLDFDIIIKYDPDCVVLDEGAVDKCIEIVMRHQDVFCSPYIEGLIVNKGGSPRIGMTHLCDELFGLTLHIGGACTVASREAWNRFGRHITPAQLHGNQDSEFSQKLRSLGYKCGYVEQYRLLHADNEFNSSDAEYWQLRKKEKVTWK
jgi:GT2 family glycosyltransferase